MAKDGPYAVLPSRAHLRRDPPASDRSGRLRDAPPWPPSRCRARSPSRPSGSPSPPHVLRPLVSGGVPTANPTHATGPSRQARHPPMLTTDQARVLIECVSSTLVCWRNPAEGALVHTWLAVLKVPREVAARSRDPSASLSADEPLRDRDDQPVRAADPMPPDQREGPRTLRTLFAHTFPTETDQSEHCPAGRPRDPSGTNCPAHAINRQSFQTGSNQKRSLSTVRPSNSKAIAGYGNNSKFSAPELEMALHWLKPSQKRIHEGSDAEIRIARLSTEPNKRSSALSEA